MQNQINPIADWPTQAAATPKSSILINANRMIWDFDAAFQEAAAILGQHAHIRDSRYRDLSRRYRLPLPITDRISQFISWHTMPVQPWFPELIRQLRTFGIDPHFFTHLKFHQRQALYEALWLQAIPKDHIHCLSATWGLPELLQEYEFVACFTDETACLNTETWQHGYTMIWWSQGYLDVAPEQDCGYSVMDDPLDMGNIANNIRVNHLGPGACISTAPIIY
ncbi:hypothetical protein HAP94_07200 [Acidithiobacillus ferrivorans]|nr:hypothetical protein [Acidithiobacillus ferrivorans]